MRLKNWLIIFLTSISITVTAQELSNYRADVTATRNGAIDVKAKGDITFDIDANNNWVLHNKLKSTVVKLDETSKGKIVDNAVYPDTYKKRSKILFIKEDINWSFDWVKNSIKGKVKKDDYNLNVSEITHDPLSFQIPLRQALINGETDFTTQYLRYNRPETLRFEVIGEELLTLDDGRVHTIILKQMAPTRSDERKLIWVSPVYDYIPIRFATYKKNKLKDEVIVRRLWIEGKEIDFNQ